MQVDVRVDLSRLRCGSHFPLDSFVRAGSAAGGRAGLLAATALNRELDLGAPGERYEVVVHVDAPALADPAQPGQSVLEGGARVSAETSRRLACDGSRVVMRHDEDGRVVEVGARTRTIPPALRRVLQHRDQGCRFPGYGLLLGEGHHARRSAEGGRTTLSNLALLCRRHQRAVHEEGYHLAHASVGEGGVTNVWRLRVTCGATRPLTLDATAPRSHTRLMPRDYRVLHVDVFTDRVLAGNQLGVVLDARGLADDEMQAIAREMNLAETTFVLPPTRPGCVARVRIFTPAREMPFAGHPTVGTAWVLAAEGLVPRDARSFTLDEAIGPVDVELEGDPKRPSFVWMRHRDATFEPEVKDRDGVAAALGLAERDLLPGAPIQSGSTGNAFLYVPVRDRATVDRVAIDQRRLETVVPDTTRIGVFVLAPDPDRAARRVYTRMFAPAHGVPEDPATGSASGALGAYLAIHGLVAPSDSVMRIVSEQGTKMGRQSFVHVTLSFRKGQVSNIRVGGGVVPALECRLTLP